MTKRPAFNYDPQSLKRELTPHYISASKEDIQAMLGDLGKRDLQDVFEHIPKDYFFSSIPSMTEALEYEALAEHLYKISRKNRKALNFIGDGLMDYKTPSCFAPLCGIRNLTTAYTPYQPERSQGTLISLWIYSNALSQLTGFEAINASLYERSTCLYEALCCALRMRKNKNTVVLSEGLYPGDLEVISTLQAETDMQIVTIPLNPETGTTDIDKVIETFEAHKENLAAFAFPQINCLGSLENIHLLTDLTEKYDCESIGVIDPILLGPGGLLPPSSWGEKGNGVNIIVGEGQHLGLPLNFGGPGLGIFGVRHHQNEKRYIRNTPGRFVGLGKDSEGKPCKVMVMSTREQHIRRDKATSNICSNQSFVATLVGAALLERGDAGLEKTLSKAHQNLKSFLSKTLPLSGVNLAFAYTPIFNQVTLKTSKEAAELISLATEEGIHLGVDVSNRLQTSDHLIQISFTDKQENKDIDRLVQFFERHFSKDNETQNAPSIPEMFLRTQSPGIPQVSSQQLISYYEKLGKLNISPDDNIYPLGSCTMKYNPYINDWAAGLEGFTETHPQAPLSEVQGNLEILYEIQEIFSRITGLPGVTTQPVAGAQGELVGLKLFQAYHRDRGNADKKKLILIPRSAHGTNPATATMAGYKTLKVEGKEFGIVLIDANENGTMNLKQIQELVKSRGEEIAGVMVTNPNTVGIFEKDFKQMADLIHSVDGLVYMDGANMNAIAGWIDLGAIGVDAVHNNLHKTWTIPHGGGGPGDAIVAVSEKLVDYLPGHQVIKEGTVYSLEKPSKSIGSFHRHFGNFAHKVRAYTYLKALGSEGIRRMSAVAVLSAQYLFKQLRKTHPSLPEGADETPRMHEFILTYTKETFQKLAENGTPKAQAIGRIGKLYLDFGIHAPTVAFPEPFGLMIEPTESYSKVELDRFVEVVNSISRMVNEHPQVLLSAPHFTPISKVDELDANKNLILSQKLSALPEIFQDKITPEVLANTNVNEICEKILEARA